MSQLARDTGLAREGLYKALSAEGNREFSSVMKVIKALGFRLHAEAKHA
jgi:probable addiction module antidote protein